MRSVKHRKRGRFAKPEGPSLRLREIGLIGVGLVFAGTVFLLHAPQRSTPLPFVGSTLSEDVAERAGSEPDQLKGPVEDPSGRDPATMSNGTFAKCATVRVTCVVDGDTFWLSGKKIRIADIDTPEISQPKCDYEYQLGMKATRRLIELLNQGAFDLREGGDRPVDMYGRELLIVVRDGKSVGQQLVNEGLARSWTGHREPWC